MITPEYVQTMARYNHWQNASIYGAVTNLTGDQRREDRGLFFGSIQSTLNHLLWGDRTWLHRFAGVAPARAAGIPDSVNEHDSWDEMVQAREVLDAEILDWSLKVDDAFLRDELSWYSGAVGRQVSKPYGLLVTHFFNHQTHHRGQVNGALTALGHKLDDTDLPFMPED